MKTETILQASENYSKGKSSSSVFQEAHKKDFIAGAEWQIEQQKDLIEVLKNITYIFEVMAESTTTKAKEYNCYKDALIVLEKYK
jgi:hypothetical protein